MKLRLEHGFETTIIWITHAPTKSNKLKEQGIIIKILSAAILQWRHPQLVLDSVSHSVNIENRLWFLTLPWHVNSNILVLLFAYLRLDFFFQSVSAYSKIERKEQGRVCVCTHTQAHTQWHVHTHTHTECTSVTRVEEIRLTCDPPPGCMLYFRCWADTETTRTNSQPLIVLQNSALPGFSMNVTYIKCHLLLFSTYDGLISSLELLNPGARIKLLPQDPVRNRKSMLHKIHKCNKCWWQFSVIPMMV